MQTKDREPGNTPARENVQEKGSDVKYRLASAMGECMKTSPVEAITVREITNRCGVSRQTFYRNFLDKYDLINWYFDKLLTRSFDQMGKGRTITESLILKFNYIREERHFFTAAFRNDDQNNLREHDFAMIFAFYRNLIREKTGEFPAPAMEEVLEMYCWAQIYRTVKWVLGGMRMSSRELAQVMVNAMPQPVERLFRALNILE
jgi:AcrR family transcriptional regulator